MVPWSVAGDGVKPLDVEPCTWTSLKSDSGPAPPSSPSHPTMTPSAPAMQVGVSGAAGAGAFTVLTVTVPSDCAPTMTRWVPVLSVITCPVGVVVVLATGPGVPVSAGATVGAATVVCPPLTVVVPLLPETDRLVVAPVSGFWVPAATHLPVTGS